MTMEDDCDKIAVPECLRGDLSLPQQEGTLISSKPFAKIYDDYFQESVKTMRESLDKMCLGFWTQNLPKPELPPEQEKVIVNLFDFQKEAVSVLRKKIAKKTITKVQVIKKIRPLKKYARPVPGSARAILTDGLK